MVCKEREAQQQLARGHVAWLMQSRGLAWLMQPRGLAESAAWPCLSNSPMPRACEPPVCQNGLCFAVEMPVHKLFVHRWAHLLHHGQAFLRFADDQAQQQINRQARAVQSLSAMHHHTVALIQIGLGEQREAGQLLAVFIAAVSSAYGIDWEDERVRQRAS
jgi:hypothetical protein